MSDEVAYAARLIGRLDEAAARNQNISNHNHTALERLDKVLPVLSKRFKGDEAIMAVIREVYSVLEEGAEESQSTITEIKQARDSLEIALNLLKQAGYDIANIQTFSNDEIWLGDHLATIERFVDIVNLQKLEVALDKAKNERFEDIAHAVKRSGEKRQSNAEADATETTPETEAAEAALDAIDAIKKATGLRDALEGEEDAPTL